MFQNPPFSSNMKIMAQISWSISLETHCLIDRITNKQTEMLNALQVKIHIFKGNKSHWNTRNDVLFVRTIKIPRPNLRFFCKGYDMVTAVWKQPIAAGVMSEPSAYSRLPVNFYRLPSVYLEEITFYLTLILERWSIIQSWMKGTM